MKGIAQMEIKNFEDLRNRVKQLVKARGNPLHPEAQKMVRDFMPELDLYETERNDEGGQHEIGIQK